MQLRVERGREAMLIHYHRADKAGPKLSEYKIATTEVYTPSSVA